MITAESSAYTATEPPAQHTQTQPNRRLLATAIRHPSGQGGIQEQLLPGSVLAQSDSIEATEHSIADSASSTGLSDTNRQRTAPSAQDTDSASKTADVGSEDTGSTLPDELKHGSQTCQAGGDVSTVCADSAQPVLAPQPWEQEEEGPSQGLTLKQCQLLNASVCEPSVRMSKEGKGFLVVVYNALAWERPTEPIRVPLDVTAGSAAHWEVTGQHALTCPARYQDCRNLARMQGYHARYSCRAIPCPARHHSKNCTRQPQATMRSACMCNTQRG